MTSTEYHAFTERLRESLEGEPAAVGLVALGSMAAIDYEPDHWSDHDFFVVVEPGEQERFRTSTNWLPDADEIVLSVRETAHGVKVIYRNGHLLEFAVFDPVELRLARINRYRVLLDRAEVTQALDEVRRETVRGLESRRADDEYFIGMMLSNLLVGVGRFARGERLSGNEFVKGHALGHLLSLSNRSRVGNRDAAIDDLDPYRRFERARPALARELESAIALSTPLAAKAILDIAQREFSSEFERIGTEAANAVRQRIDEAVREVG